MDPELLDDLNACTEAALECLARSDIPGARTILRGMQDAIREALETIDDQTRSRTG